MEVFMRNVPAHLTDQSLKADIKIQDWQCRKHRNKNLGTITFHTRSDGLKFLRQYGEVEVPGAMLRNGMPKTRGQLNLLGAMVYCKESTQAPEPLTLKVLEKQAEDREATKNLEQEVNTNTTMSLTGLSCGHYDYPNGKLAYMIDMQITCNGIIKFAKNMLIVTYHELDGSIRLEVPYRIIHEIVVSTKPRALTITLWESPRFFSMETNPSQEQFAPTRKRISKLPHRACDHGRFVGQSLVYQFSTSSLDLHHKMEKIAEDKALDWSSYKSLTSARSLVQMGDAMAALIQTFGQVDRYIPFDVTYQFHALAHGGYFLPQTIESLLLRLRKYSANTAEAARSTNIRSFCPFSAAAVKKLAIVEFAGPAVEAAVFSVDTVWRQLLDNEQTIRLDLSQDLITDRASTAMVLVYKVQITPTRLLFTGPELEPNNRVLRKFSDHTEYFARLQLCEEDGQDMFFNPKVAMETIWQRFRTVLVNGVQICGRVYKFLGFSHSSLRAHAVWAMAPFHDSRISSTRNYFNVISELGEFDEIRAPARRAARIGQAFSDTRVAIPLDGVLVELIPDVKSDDGSRVFSDGVGTISRGLLEHIQDQLPEKMGTSTCFQIRWAGAKGMLSLDATLPGVVMRIRKESMIKFPSNDKQNLEICDAASKATPLVLNRQMIKILEDMGVPAEWFLREQAIEVSRLRKITSDVNNTVTFLKRQRIGDQMRFSRFLKNLHELGINYKTDRFLCTVIEAVVLRELRLLKNKGRIPVEYGVTLFGVMDEFNYLEEDEIFVTFDDLEGTHYLDLDETLCIVTRSPALHPGDIKKVRNIVPPEGHPLRSLRNCIVFSQNGERDLPSQLSGGDLDGDKFSVIWDERAVSRCHKISEPADYPRVPPLELGRNIESEDLINFFVQFMATDQLGLIANRHLIYADQKEGGTLDPVCTSLAQLHSTAVDYSKTGVPVDLGELRSLRAPRYRPDFMSPTPPANLKNRSEIAFETPLLPAEEIDEDDQSGPQFQYYKSDKVLGKLFRNIDEERIWQEDIRMFAARKGATLWERLLHFIKSSCVIHHLGPVNWHGAVPEAREIHNTYNDALWALTMDYSENAGEPITEVEIFTGSIFNCRGLPTKRQGERSLQLKDEFDRVTRWIESLIRQHKMRDYIMEEEDYNEDVRASNGFSHAADTWSQHFSATPLELSIACLHVATMKDSRAPRRSRRLVADGNFESFKIIAASCALRELNSAVGLQRPRAWVY
ncbi:RNA dependent RNA polymerase-domain-containing protein [Microdochium trichocladiopsis]|uniref:RNA-dependent RNA polymerase n=1 Tax=Microdochium trichocladiopsis TaxID=1682393 RepID=A0A9P8YDM3_9PEZI|nr:RNA dependent RNA polymerase-domain-containing protein [Microdochium trichocladiopsis]KAH7039872.1 RNA dependent RNA polymerase-domain-containing protein [Microdochium trichocladiopsis]